MDNIGILGVLGFWGFYLIIPFVLVLIVRMILISRKLKQNIVDSSSELMQPSPRASASFNFFWIFLSLGIPISLFAIMTNIPQYLQVYNSMGVTISLFDILPNIPQMGELGYVLTIGWINISEFLFQNIMLSLKYRKKYSRPSVAICILAIISSFVLFPLIYLIQMFQVNY